VLLTLINALISISEVGLQDAELSITSQLINCGLNLQTLYFLRRRSIYLLIQ